MELPGSLVKQFQKALMEAFPKPGELVQMVRFELDQNLAAIAGQENLSQATFDLIQHCESHDKIEALLSAAQQSNHTNKALKAFAKELYQWKQTQLKPLADPPQEVWDDAVKRYKKWAKKTYGSIKMFKMPSPVRVDTLFTTVKVYENRLEHLLRANQVVKNPFRTDASLEPEDALKVARRCPQLYVVGQPGAGKTTFSKALLVQALKGRTLGLPIMIQLRDWWPRRNQFPTLESFMADQLEKAQQGFPRAKEFLKKMLNDGQLLILLDGLDEISTEPEPGHPYQHTQRRVAIQQIEDLMDRYGDNRFVLTCRTAAADYGFPNAQFQHVEIAPFDDAQVEAFVHNWFKDEPELAPLCLNAIRGQSNLKELARSPILLTLLCLSFRRTKTYPPRRAEIYEAALSLLLDDLDDFRDIARAPIYEGLHTGRKHDLLTSFALATFSESQVAIPTQILSERIESFLQGLPRSEARGQDLSKKGLGSDVLQVIEEQHGILVKRVEGWYSFAHLTFHEYYAAREVIQNPSKFPLLIKNSHQDRWREVILLTASQLRGDAAVQFVEAWETEFRNQVRFIPGLLEFLKVVNDFGEGTPLVYRISRVCTALALAYDRDLDLVRNRARAVLLDFTFGFVRALARLIDLDLVPAFNLVRILVLARLIDLDINIERDINFDLARDIDLARVPARKEYQDVFCTIFLCIGSYLSRGRDKAIEQILRSNLDRFIAMVTQTKAPKAFVPALRGLEINSEFERNLQNILEEHWGKLYGPAFRRLASQNESTVRNYLASTKLLLEVLDTIQLPADYREAVRNRLLSVPT